LFQKINKMHSQRIKTRAICQWVYIVFCCRRSAAFIHTYLYTLWQFIEIISDHLLQMHQFSRNERVATRVLCEKDEIGVRAQSGGGGGGGAAPSFLCAHHLLLCSSFSLSAASAGWGESENKRKLMHTAHAQHDELWPRAGS
jgi:hypothetical protein